MNVIPVFNENDAVLSSRLPKTVRRVLRWVLKISDIHRAVVCEDIPTDIGMNSYTNQTDGQEMSQAVPEPLLASRP